MPWGSTSDAVRVSTGNGSLHSARRSTGARPILLGAVQGNQRSLLDSLRAAVAAAPDDVALRLHLAELLMSSGEGDEAIAQTAVVLQRDPTNVQALLLVRGTVRGAADLQISDQPTGSGDESLRQLADAVEAILPAPFVDVGDSDSGLVQAEQVTLRLADVAGMVEVKARLEAAFLAPIRNPALVELYGKSLRGGLLLYGPRRPVVSLHSTAELT